LPSPGLALPDRAQGRWPGVSGVIRADFAALQFEDLNDCSGDSQRTLKISVVISAESNLTSANFGLNQFG